MRAICVVVTVLLASACALPEVAPGRIQVRSVTSQENHGGEGAYESAKRQLALGNLGLAIDGFRKAARENPTSPDALNGLAVAYDRIGRFDLSRQAFEEALALAPSDPAILRNLERSLVVQGRHAEAAQLARELGTELAAVSPRTERTPTKAADAPASRPGAGLRIERISTREVALITGERRNGWELAAANVRPAATRPFASSRNGVLEIPLPPVVSASGSPVVVLNAVGRRGLARRMSGYLRERGWEKTSIGDARTHRRRTILVHAPKDRLSAISLARTLPFHSQLVPSRDVQVMVLLLGTNAVGFDERARGALKS